MKRDSQENIIKTLHDNLHVNEYLINIWSQVCKDERDVTPIIIFKDMKKGR